MEVTKKLNYVHLISHRKWMYRVTLSRQQRWSDFVEQQKIDAFNALQGKCPRRVYKY